MADNILMFPPMDAEDLCSELNIIFDIMKHRKAMNMIGNFQVIDTVVSTDVEVSRLQKVEDLLTFPSHTLNEGGNSNWPNENSRDTGSSSDDMVEDNSKNFLMENFGYLDDIMPMRPPAPQVATQPAPDSQHPKHWDSFPSMENVETDFDFQINIDPGKDWECNKNTSKVYLKVRQVMTTRVSYKQVDTSKKLFLRAMIVVFNLDDIQRPIKRCANHRVVNEHPEVPLAHMMRCIHPNAEYIGDEKGETFGARLSCTIPLSPSIDTKGIASETIKLEFFCQNSCVGIKRKATAVIFTLEDERFEIVGRCVMPFKVCACPRRDIVREDPSLKKCEPSVNIHEKLPVQKSFHEKKATVQTPKSTKLLTKVSKPVTAILKLPSKKLMRHVLRCANNEVHGLIALSKTPEDAEKYKKYARSIRHLLDAHSDD